LLPGVAHDLCRWRICCLFDFIAGIVGVYLVCHDYEIRPEPVMLQKRKKPVSGQVKKMGYFL
jgi:hypothetical protein